MAPEMGEIAVCFAVGALVFRLILVICFVAESAAESGFVGLVVNFTKMPIYDPMFMEEISALLQLTVSQPLKGRSKPFGRRD